MTAYGSGPKNKSIIIQRENLSAYNCLTDISCSKIQEVLIVYAVADFLAIFTGHCFEPR
jgi:hypothetical protein